MHSKNQLSRGVCYIILNNNFQFLNNIIRIYTHFFHTLITKHIFLSTCTKHLMISFSFLMISFSFLIIFGWRQVGKLTTILLFLLLHIPFVFCAFTLYGKRSKKKSFVLANKIMFTCRDKSKIENFFYF